jgi:hypothetical protein
MAALFLAFRRGAVSRGLLVAMAGLYALFVGVLVMLRP